MVTPTFCNCQHPKPIRDVAGVLRCFAFGHQIREKSVEERGNGDTMSEAEKARKAEIEILERKARAMIALGQEILNRLREMKAA